MCITYRMIFIMNYNKRFSIDHEFTDIALIFILQLPITNAFKPLFENANFCCYYHPRFIDNIMIISINLDYHILIALIRTSNQ